MFTIKNVPTFRSQRPWPTFYINTWYWPNQTFQPIHLDHVSAPLTCSSQHRASRNMVVWNNSAGLSTHTSLLHSLDPSCSFIIVDLVFTMATGEIYTHKVRMLSSPTMRGLWILPFSFCKCPPSRPLILVHFGALIASQPCVANSPSNWDARPLMPSHRVMAEICRTYCQGS